jgi:hypothetical protein
MNRITLDPTVTKLQPSQSFPLTEFASFPPIILLYVIHFFPTAVTSILILSKFFYSPTDAQENCFKKDIKIYIKTAPTCFGLITVIRERSV